MTNEYAEALDRNNYAHSILQDNVGEQCFMCRQKHCELVRHEVFQGMGNRIQSKHYGLWITVCPTCHKRIHSKPKAAANVALKKEAERAARAYYHWNLEDWVERFGRSVLSDVADNDV